MKNSKLRKVLLLACSAVLLVCLSVGATVAYLTSAKTVTNTFTVGKVDITLNEAAVKTDEATGNVVADETKNRVTGNSYKLQPGLSYAKDPTVTVASGSEKCYVKMTVTVTKADVLDAIFKANGYTNLQSIVIGYDGTKWIDKGNKKSEDGTTRTYEFWYASVVDARSAEKKLEPLFTTIKMPGNITNTQLASLEGMNITVNAYAIQADGFADAAAAWTAYAAQ